MLFDDTYKTIQSESEGLFKDRGSKFIGYAFPVLTEEDLKVKLEEVKKLHPSARHYCYAYRLGPSGDAWRANDDGEPSGTAGKPILNQLLSAGLTNCLIIVVRYFGGTLLGVPGLINAYKQAASEALSAAACIEKTVNDRYNVQFTYEQMNDVMRILKDDAVNIINQGFDNLNCDITFEVRKSAVNRICDLLDGVKNVKPQYLFTS